MKIQEHRSESMQNGMSLFVYVYSDESEGARVPIASFD